MLTERELILIARRKATLLLAQVEDEYNLVALDTLDKELDVNNVAEVEALLTFTHSNNLRQKAVREGAAYYLEKIQDSKNLKPSV